MDYATRHIAHGNITLWTEWFPSESDSACLLIGGAGSISAFWPDEFCRSIANLGLTVIRYDHRNAGRSSFIDAVASPFALSDLAEDAMAISNELGVRDVHVVGHSMGGFIAQTLAVEHPKRIRSLTSISSHPGSPDVPQPSEATWATLLSNRPTGVLDDDLPGSMKIRRFLNGECPFDEPMARRYTEELYRRNPATSPAAYHAAIVNAPDRTSALRRLNLPSLIVHGDCDPLFSLRCGHMTAEAVPNAQFTVLEKAGHMFFNQAIWKTLETAVLEHLASLR